MVEYAYFYPKNYNQARAALFVNLKNITNDSPGSYASATTFEGTSIIQVNVENFDNVVLPENAQIVDEYIEIATEVVVTKGTPKILMSSPSGFDYLNNTYSVKKVNTTDRRIRVEFSNGVSGCQFQLRVFYIRLVIEYKLPNYNVTARRIDHNNLLNDETSINVNITNINQSDHTPRVTLSLPEGVELVSSDSAIQTSSNILTWIPTLNKTKLSASLTLRFKLLTLGIKTFTVEESYQTSPTRTISFTCTENIDDDTPDEDEKGIPISVIHSGSVGLDDIQNTIYQIGYNTVNITIRCDDEILEVLDYITFTDSNGLCETITPHDDSDFIDNTTIFEITPTGSGGTDLEIEYQLTIDGVATVYKAQHYILNVLPETLTYPFFTVLKLTEEELCRLGNHTNYTIQTWMKITNNALDFQINDWIKNYRIGVYNPEEVPEGVDITDLTLEEIFDGVEEWSNQPASVNEYNSIECTFTYHKENPLYVVITGDYADGNTNSIIDYSVPGIVETSEYNGYETTGNYFLPIDGLISDTLVSEVDVGKFNESTTIVLSDFGLDDDFGTNESIGVTGVELNLECDYNDIIAVLVRLKSPSGKIGQRSIILSEGIANITLGGPYDTFGFDVSELTNLNDFEIEVQANNFFNNANNIANLKVHNATMTFYFNKIDDVLVDTLIDGVDIRYYGLFLEDVEMPEGLQTITKYLEIEGTDSHDSYRQNIDRKEIKLKMSVDGCNIHDTSEMIRNITKVFQNKRDTLNKPIPKTLEFGNKPDLYWEYILEDPIETDFESANANLEVTLVIPSGTAFAKEETITNVTGGVTGIAKVNPVIVIIPLGDHVELLETNTQQKFSINYTSWTSENIVEIDCNNREVLLTSEDYDAETIDISKAVDFNSDWFLLDDDYTFEPTNCIIQSVTFTERW